MQFQAYKYGLKPLSWITHHETLLFPPGLIDAQSLILPPFIKDTLFYNKSCFFFYHVLVHVSASMLVFASVWLIKAAVCRRPLRCLRRGSCCSHAPHLSLAYIAPAVLATCRSYIHIALAVRIHCTHLLSIRCDALLLSLPYYYLRTLPSYCPSLPLPPILPRSSTLAVAKTEGQYTKIYISVVNTCRALLHDRELEVELPPNALLPSPITKFPRCATQRQLWGSRPARVHGGGEEEGHWKAQDTCTSAECAGLECAA